MTRKKDIMAICAAYQPIEGKASRAERVAHCLVYFGDEMPLEPVPPNILHKAISQSGRTPQKGSKEVLALIGGMSSVGRLLKSKHDRLLVTVRGVGYRVSVNDEDAARHKLAVSVKNKLAADARVEDDAAHINVSKIQDPTTKAWAGRVVKHLKEHNAEEVIKGILPPGTPTPEKK
jgi:hypothetical protein